VKEVNFEEEIKSKKGRSLVLIHRELLESSETRFVKGFDVSLFSDIFHFLSSAFEVPILFLKFIVLP